jgi:hypothetical protein
MTGTLRFTLQQQLHKICVSLARTEKYYDWRNDHFCRSVRGLRFFSKKNIIIIISKLKSLNYIEPRDLKHKHEGKQKGAAVWAHPQRQRPQ